MIADALWRADLRQGPQLRTRLAREEAGSVAQTSRILCADADGKFSCEHVRCFQCHHCMESVVDPDVESNASCCGERR